MRKEIKEKLEKLSDLRRRIYADDKISALDAAHKTDKSLRKYPASTASNYTSLNLDNSMEEELKDVFPKLPRKDQIVIVDRLVLLKNSLLAVGNQCGSLDFNTPRETSSQHAYNVHEESDRPENIMNPVKGMVMLLDSNNSKTDKEAVRNNKIDDDSGSYLTIAKSLSMTNPSSAVALVDLISTSDVQMPSASMTGNPSRFLIKGMFLDSVKSAGNGCVFKDQNNVLDIINSVD
ncbi:UNVERIFIED_CONTAM: hypothetical protein K2H54_053060 [Gekko kuhli]